MEPEIGRWLSFFSSRSPLMGWPNLLQPCFHCRDGDQFGFDNPAGGGGFREGLRQIRRKALKAGMGVLNIVGRQANVG
jgi:hypothetical protein